MAEDGDRKRRYRRDVPEPSPADRGPQCSLAHVLLALGLVVAGWKVVEQMTHLHRLDLPSAGPDDDGEAAPLSTGELITSIVRLRETNRELTERIRTAKARRRAAQEAEAAAQAQRLRAKEAAEAAQAAEAAHAAEAALVAQQASAAAQAKDAAEAPQKPAEPPAQPPPAPPKAAPPRDQGKKKDKDKKKTPSEEVAPIESCPEGEFGPADDATKQSVAAAGWPLRAAQGGQEVFVEGKPLKGLECTSKWQLRFFGTGALRIHLQAVGGAAAVLLNGAEAIWLRKGDSGSITIAYVANDILEISLAPGATKVAVKELKVVGHSCGGGAGGAADGASCSSWQRVRLPWTRCQDGTRSEVDWVEGRVSKVVDGSTALVEIAQPSQCGSIEFDPTSPFTRYQDEGECGPRGDDAEVDIRQCPSKRLERIVDVPNVDYKIAASVKGCNFFSYSVFRCLEAAEPSADHERDIASTMVTMPARMLAPLEEEPPAGFVEGSLKAALARSRCGNFKQEEGRRIAMILLGDLHFQRKYRYQIQSLHCYADRHGYEFKLLTGSEHVVCRKFKDYFFKKHCTVAEWLEEQSPNLVAAIIDADVVAAVPHRGLERWANYPADVQLYQRCLLPEIMAGNYMVRNSPYARGFLRKWASYNFEMPLGYSSSDNGAIHLVVQEYVQADGFPKCLHMYKSLTASVMDLNPYFNFTKCVTDALGPPRAWHSKGGVVAVWPRFNFWASDGVYLSKQGNREIGPVIHHGIKDAADVLGHYYTNVSKCELNSSAVLRTREEFGTSVLWMARGYPEYFPQGKKCKGTAQRQCPETCLPLISCAPLGDQEPPLVKRSCTDCG